MWALLVGFQYQIWNKYAANLRAAIYLRLIFIDWYIYKNNIMTDTSRDTTPNLGICKVEYAHAHHLMRFSILP